MSADQLTAYQLATCVHEEHGVPVFPVRLTRDPSGKWQKMPLCKWSQGKGHPFEFNWRQANALGVPMGRRSGLLTLDLDTYKDGNEAQAWIEKHQLPATRIHQTASGGQHLIFRLPAGYDLGNHAPKVQGLDVRGTGGFIVWADIDGHYDVVNDLVPALDDLFSDYFVARKVTPYTRELGPIALMTLVLRAVTPGAFQKVVPLLEGDQDIGKSTGLAALCPYREWFGDSLPPLHNKDVSTYLAGKFIIEIAELAATKRADIDDLKSFLSRSVEKYRPPYGRQEVEQPRRCMFWGTTNRQDYLRDETGSSRFYPVVLTAVDVDAIKRDRDQLLGEALCRLEQAQSDELRWWDLSEAALVELEELRGTRTEDHPWTSDVLRFVEGLEEVAIPAILGDEHGGECLEMFGRRETDASVPAVKIGLRIPKANRTRGDSLTVAGILTQHGWERDGKFTSGRFKDNARYVRKARP